MGLSEFLSGVARTSDVVADSLRPVPRAGAAAADMDDADDAHGVAARLIRDFRAQMLRGNPLTLDGGTLASIVDALRHSNAVDDRKLLLEHVLTLLSRLPEQSALTIKLSNAVVTMLYYDLSHPPATYLDAPARAGPPQPLPAPNYAWRLPGGEYNSLAAPELGRAGSKYSRTIQAKHPVSDTARPDPGLVFDTLLKRDKFVEHPAGLSSLMFSFAALVIHTVFYTSHADPTVNLTTSYVDLSPLYGFTPAAQDGVRRLFHAADRYAHDDTGYGAPAYAARPLGRGLLHEDAFAEDRFLLLPPASAVLLVLFCRNHNYIAGKLLEVNERGTYADPRTLPAPGGADEPAIVKRLTVQDDEIFNIAKLVNCAWFAMVVFSDYFSSILGLVRNGSSWSLDPFEEIRMENHEFVGRGEGNSCSVEFNHVYHWHATVSREDEAWTERVFKGIWPDIPPTSLTPADFLAGVAQVKKMENPDVSTWTFNALQRGPDGRFADADLARILQDSNEHAAGAFRARGTPGVLRIVDILGIAQSRRWGVCTLNEFRAYFGLKRYTSFEEWNPDPEISQAAYRLYGHIDNLELYTGLQAEEPKPVVDGAGLCPGYSISRAILGDAIALTRGDRFFTTDFTPWNLTPWGYADCAKDPTNPGFGSQLGRLLLRTLPDHYTPNSVYTWFPLMTPPAMRKNLTKLGTAAAYDFARPVARAPVTRVAAYDAAAALLRDGVAPAGRFARALVIGRGPGFFVTLDDPARAERDRRQVGEALLGGGGLAAARAWFGTRAREMLKERSYVLVGNTVRAVDLVRDVLNMLPVHWAATEVAGLVLKTREHPHGVWVEAEMQQMLREIYSCIFLETDPAKRVLLERNAAAHTAALLARIRRTAQAVSGSAFSLANVVAAWFGKPDAPVKAFVKRLHEMGKGEEELANNVLAVVVAGSVELAQGLVHVVNFYLDPKNAAHRARIVELSQTEGTECDALLEGYVREALRLDPPLPGPFREVTTACAHSGQSFAVGETVYVDLAAVGQERTVFPNPGDVDPSRAKELYTLMGDGAHRVLGNDFVHQTMAEVLKAVFSLKNLRCAPGRSGILNRLPHDVHGQTHYEYLDQHQVLVPWANSMVVQFDE